MLKGQICGFRYKWLLLDIIFYDKCYFLNNRNRSRTLYVTITSVLTRISDIFYGSNYQTEINHLHITEIFAVNYHYFLC